MHPLNLIENQPGFVNVCLIFYPAYATESKVFSTIFNFYSLRFVIAHKNGVVEFCHIKTKNVGHKRTNSLPNSSYASREIEISRSVIISHSSIIYMDIAIDKIYVVSLQGQVKVREDILA